ncbi:MAG: hypothetical protein OXS33_05585 [bacterium]|nr:hypothetical protein [bacterium]
MPVTVPSGYSLTRDFFGTVTEQGRLKLVTLSLPWVVLTDLVVAPDPDQQSDFNRPLTVPHARRFGQYLDRTDDAFTPPISLFADPDFVKVKSLKDPTLDDFGLRVVEIKRTAEIFILDGQHRIFGVMTLAKEYSTKLRRLKDRQAKVHSSEQELLNHFNNEIRRIQKKQEQLALSEVTVQILLTGRGSLAKRIFADVADNAKGISQSQLADFSDRSVFNRVARTISQTTLDGLVDHVRDRLSQKNPNWLSLKDVVNVAQAMQLEIGQRWTMTREEVLKTKERAIAGMTREFFEGLLEHFEELQQLKTATIVGYDLRKGGEKLSLLGSATIIRALAAAYSRLRRGADEHRVMSHAEVFDAWSSALPPMTAGHLPHESEDPDQAQPLIDPVWLATGLFKYPYVAPNTARVGDLRHLAKLIEGRTRGVLEEHQPAN